MRAWLIVVTSLLVLTIAGGGAVYELQRRQVEELQARVTEAETAAAEAMSFARQTEGDLQALAGAMVSRDPLATQADLTQLEEDVFGMGGRGFGEEALADRVDDVESDIDALASDVRTTQADVSSICIAVRQDYFVFC